MSRVSEVNNFIPWIINLELTNACNLECIFCDHKDLKKQMKIKNMTIGILKKILEDAQGIAKGKKIHELGLVGLGEPTLDSDLAKHLELIGRYKAIFERITLNSNLVSLTSSQARMLINSKINAYTFSVNAHDRKSYLKLMGKDYFERVINNLNIFLGLLKSSLIKPRVDVQVLKAGNANIKELKARLPELDGLNVNFFIRKVYNKPILRNGKRLLKLYEPDNKKRYPCWDIYTRAYIDVNGNLYPCTIGNDCYREGSNLRFGNICDHSILSLFNGKSAKEARYGFESGQIPFLECESCNIWALTPNNFTWNKPYKKWEIKQKQVRAYGLKR